MELTVLGCYGPYPSAGGACSGYLLEEDDFKVLVDCGNGTLSRLQQLFPFWELDAVLVSHLHSDHIADLLIMRYGLDYVSSKNRWSGPLPVYAPSEPAADFARLPYKEVYSLNPIGPEQKLQLGPFAFSFAWTVHALPCLAIRAETPRGIFVYSGDTEAFPELSGFARGADLFLCEANFQNADMAADPPNHLSAAQAAQIAAEAGVGQLLLTHLHPERERAVSLQEAKVHFQAAEAAVEGACYAVGR